VGEVVVGFRLAPGGIDLLVKLGWLDADKRQHTRKVQEAFDRFVNAAAAAGIKPNADATW
jgi:hypothetical protein